MLIRAFAFLGQTAFFTIAISLIEVIGMMMYFSMKKHHFDKLTWAIVIPVGLLLIVDSVGAIYDLAYVGYQSFWMPTMIAVTLNLIAFAVIYRIETSK